MPSITEEELKQAGTAEDIEWRYLCPDGQLEHELTISELKLASANEELRSTQAKLTESEAEILLLREELAQQRKALVSVTAELDSLSYGISHDLRSPLRHLVGFSGALEEDYRDSLDATALGYLDCISRAARKMELLVEALLKLSRVTRGELTITSVDLSALVRECAATLKASAPEREVTFQIEDGLLVQADPGLMKTAVEHLLENAWKFTAKKDSATIEFGRREDGGGTVFYVRDDGAGFDMQYADKLFGPFQRMHKESEFAGAGVGLATARKILLRHGGRIWAEAEVDAGATFYFALPE